MPRIEKEKVKNLQRLQIDVDDQHLLIEAFQFVLVNFPAKK
jgi:hypothetical protein